MAHRDALTSACLLSLKGSVASFWLCADDFRSSPTRRQIQSPSGFAFVPWVDGSGLARAFFTVLQHWSLQPLFGLLMRFT